MQKLMIASLSTLILTSSLNAEAKSLWGIFGIGSKKQEEIRNEHLNLIDADLFAIQAQELETLGRAGLKKQSEAAIKDLNDLEIERVVETGPNSDKSERMNSISVEQANKVLEAIRRHPVVSEYVYDKYNHDDAEIGFCFGRAAFVHIALGRLGVNKDAIKKIWVVGPMLAGGVNWAFHVATVVKSNEGPWIVIDSFVGRILKVEDWMKQMEPLSRPQNSLRFFITDPQKFSANLGKYDTIQFGLKLERPRDWYRGYFTDLMAWFRNHEENLKSVGLDNF